MKLGTMEQVKKEMSEKKKKDFGLKHFICENTNILKKELLSIFRGKGDQKSQKKKKSKTENVVYQENMICQNEDISKRQHRNMSLHSIQDLEEEEDDEYMLFLRYIYNDISSFIEHTQSDALQIADPYDLEHFMTTICNDICKKAFKNVKQVFNCNETRNGKNWENRENKKYRKSGTNGTNGKRKVCRYNGKEETEKETQEEENDKEESDKEKSDKEKSDKEESDEEEYIKINPSDSFFFIPPFEYIVSYINKLNIKDIQQFIKNNDCDVDIHWDIFSKQSKRRNHIKNFNKNEAKKETEREKEKKEKKEKEEREQIQQKKQHVKQHEEEWKENYEKTITSCYTAINDNSSSYYKVNIDENKMYSFLENEKHKKDIHDLSEKKKRLYTLDHRNQKYFDKSAHNDDDKKQHIFDHHENKNDKVFDKNKYHSSLSPSLSPSSSPYSSSSSHSKNRNSCNLAPYSSTCKCNCTKMVMSESEHLNEMCYKHCYMCDVENKTKTKFEKSACVEKHIYVNDEQDTKKQICKKNSVESYISKLGKKKNGILYKKKSSIKKEIISQYEKRESIEKALSNELKEKQEIHKDEATDNNNNNNNNNNISNNIIFDCHNVEHRKELMVTKYNEMKLPKVIETNEEKQNEKWSKKSYQKNQEKEQNEINEQKHIHEEKQANTYSYNRKQKVEEIDQLQKNEYKEKLQKLLRSKKNFKEEVTNKNDFRKNENLHDDYYYFKYLNKSENIIDPYLFTKAECKKKIRVTPSAFPQFLRDIQICDAPPKKIRLKRTNIAVKNETYCRNKSEERKKNKKKLDEKKNNIEHQGKENEKGGGKT